jgi:glutamyl-tRNA synthetase
MEYKAQGYLPEALLNYLVRLGWSYGDQEIFTIDEMIEHFSLEAVNNAPSTFNPEKCLWVNQQHIQRSSGEHLARHLAPFMTDRGCDLEQGPALSEVAELLKERSKTLVEMADQATYFYKDFDQFDEQAAKKHLRPVAETPLKRLKTKLEKLDPWTASAIGEAIEQTAAELEIGMGKVGMPLRVAITGMGQSPSIDQVAALLGRDRVLARLEKALAFIEQRKATS